MTELLTTPSQRTAPTLSISVAGTKFAYRELGPRTDIPLVVLTHLAANLDSWDPRLLDGLTEDRRVIALDYRGVGNSTGKVRDSIEDMAEDMAAVIHALGYDRIDLFGLSMGGMVGQAMAAQMPELIDRLILAGSGPAGGPGLTAMTRVFMKTALRAAITFQDPRTLLFFTRTPAGKKAAGEYLARLKERTTGRDRPVTPRVYRAQLAAVRRWGLQQPAGRSQFAGPALIFHGDSDLMVRPRTPPPSQGSYQPPHSRFSRIPVMAPPSNTIPRSSTRPASSSADNGKPSTSHRNRSNKHESLRHQQVQGPAAGIRCPRANGWGA